MTSPRSVEGESRGEGEVREGEVREGGLSVEGGVPVEGGVRATPVQALIYGACTIGCLALAAWYTGEPLVFPSLGPTAFLFVQAPGSLAASPRSTVIGHLAGLAAGFACLALFGLLDAPAATATGVDLARAAAAGLSLGLTSAAMLAFDAPHPPAGATTLIVSLGILRTPHDLAAMMVAIVALTLVAAALDPRLRRWSGGA